MDDANIDAVAAELMLTLSTQPAGQVPSPRVEMQASVSSQISNEGEVSYEQWAAMHLSPESHAVLQVSNPTLSTFPQLS